MHFCGDDLHAVVELSHKLHLSGQADTDGSSCDGWDEAWRAWMVGVLISSNRSSSSKFC